MSLTFRRAEEGDAKLILQMIEELAVYENMLNQVVATEEILREWLFEKRSAEVIFAVEDGTEIGYALYFNNFSTFQGRAGLYLEDIYVKPAYRGKGCGKALFRFLAALAVARGCGRMEWACLDWNKPSIGFYLSMGAQPLDDWTVYRLTGEALGRLAET